MYELLDPYIREIILAVAGIFTALVLAIFAELRKRVLNLFDKNNKLKDREYLYFLAVEAFSFIESTMKNSSSQDKINSAISYVSQILEREGVNVNSNEIRGAIEQAVIEYNLKIKNK